MSREVVGFVGVGTMGALFASRLLDAGYQLCLCDTNRAAVAPFVARGAAEAATAADVASASDVVLLSLPTPAIVDAVTTGETGLLRGSRATTIVDLSTTGPSAAVRVAAAAAARGVAWVDSPVTGGPSGAKAGTLAVIVACPRDTFARVEAILKVFGRPYHVGEKPGLAQVAKLANNLLSMTALAASCEAVAMGVKAGLDPAQLVEIINAGSGRNSATQDKFPKSILPGTFDYGFATGLSHKDVRLAVDEAEALGVPMVVGAAVVQLYAITNALYGPDSDFTSIARLVETWAGVEMRSRKA